MLKWLPDKLFDLWRKFFATYSIIDPQAIARENPYTYYLPQSDFLSALTAGDIVKIIFDGHPAGRKHSSERMWVKITEREGDNFVGLLDNIPFDMPQLSPGDRVEFSLKHIIDIDWDDEELEKRRLNRREKRQYWDRCLVDKVVLSHKIPVQYIYRETPDMGNDDDKYPDSGWRIRGNIDLMTQEQYDNEDASYIAIGKVLNIDDSWLDLVDSPIGSRFFKNEETGKFEADTEE